MSQLIYLAKYFLLHIIIIHQKDAFLYYMANQINHIVDKYLND